jgi:fatty-acyl-CoA synthase
MTALTLMSYPFAGRPVYLALAPLTHAAGVLCLPIMTLGGEIVIMPAPDLAEFLSLIGRHRVTHAFLPPTLIYLLLDHPGLAAANLTSLQCLWYGAAPMSAARLEQAIGAIGPVLGQLFGQTEAPMMISTLAPKDHLHADGTLAREPDEGSLLPAGQRGGIVVRGPLVMAGYYKDPAATAEASRHG